MTAALLAPAALAVGVLLLGPVLAHLARKDPTGSRPFGALMLLRRLQRRFARRRRVHDPLLLLLRLLALALVVLAAARPEVRVVEAPSDVGGSGRVVVMLDRSMSMDQRERGDAAFAVARRDAAALVRDLPSDTQVAVVLVGAVPSVLVGWTDDRSVAAATLEAVEVSGGATDLRGALNTVRELLGDEVGEVVVFTDEAGPGVVEACDEELERLLARGVAVIPRVYGPAERANLAPVFAEYGDGLEGGSVRVRLANWGPVAREAAATVTLPDGASMTAFVEVPAASEGGPGLAEERYTVPRQAEGGVARVSLEDPALPMDDTRWFHLPRVGASRVLVVDGDPGSSPTRSEVYFLERALAPFGASGPAVDVVAPSGMGTLDPDRHRVVFLANVGDPGPQAPMLVDFVRRGGGLVVAMGDNVTADRWNAPLSSILPAPLRRTRDLVSFDADAGVPLLPPDVDGPHLFRPFARGGRQAFARVTARRVMTLDQPEDPSSTTVLLRYADGVPALVERAVGAGRVLLWTGTLDLGWGDLPIHAIFTPLVQRMVAELGGETGADALAKEGEVGVPMVVPVPPTVSGDLEVLGPDGGIVPSERGTREVRFTPESAGAYAVRAEGAPPVAWAAVNPPTTESDVRRGASLVATQARIAPDRMTRRWGLSMPLLFAGVIVVALAAGVQVGALGGGRVADV